MRYLIFLLGLLVANVAQAMDCEKVPDCASLGYSTKDDPNCADNGYMYCPFDQNYKVCVQYNCAALGFTEDDKTSWCEDIIYCASNDSYSLCETIQLQCEIGDVFYADRTCGKVTDFSKESGKIPVGVVYWVTDNGRHGKIINLHDLGRKSNSPFDPENPYNSDKNLYWGYFGHNVKSLTNYNSDNNTLKPLQNRDPDLYNGQGNTDKILADSGPIDCKYGEDTEEYFQYCIPQAAQATHDFYPPNVDKQNPIVGQGKWYLPSYGELLDLYGYDNSKITVYQTTVDDHYDSSGAIGNIKKTINNTLSTLKSKGVATAEELAEKFYWSSSENSDKLSWGIWMPKGDRGNNRKFNDNPVRASLEF